MFSPLVLRVPYSFGGAPGATTPVLLPLFPALACVRSVRTAAERQAKQIRCKKTNRTHPFEVVEVAEAVLGSSVGVLRPERFAQLPHAPRHGQQHRRVSLVDPL